MQSSQEVLTRIETRVRQQKREIRAWIESGGNPSEVLLDPVNFRNPQNNFYLHRLLVLDEHIRHSLHPDRLENAELRYEAIRNSLAAMAFPELYQQAEFRVETNLQPPSFPLELTGIEVPTYQVAM